MHMINSKYALLPLESVDLFFINHLLTKKCMYQFLITRVIERKDHASLNNLVIIIN